MNERETVTGNENSEEVTAREQWNYIVERYNKCYNLQESAIQYEWENYCSEIFGYKKIFGEIDVQRQIQIGSGTRVIPDIILRRGVQDVFDLELKQYNLTYDEKMENQLKSYLKLLNLTVGAVVCMKIYLCYYEQSEDKIYRIAIPFEKDNADGIAFVKMLYKKTFSAEKIVSYIKNKIKKEINRRTILGMIDEGFVKDCILDFFATDYDKDLVKEILDEIEIAVKEKGTAPIPVSRPVKSGTSSLPLKQVIHITKGWVGTLIKENGNYVTVNFGEHGLMLCQKNEIRLPEGTNPQPKPDTADFPLSPDFIIIKTHWDRVNVCKSFFKCSDEEALYHATRHCWRVSYDKVIRYGYALAVIDGYVKEVYKTKTWNYIDQNSVWEIDNDKAPGRYEFIGEVAENAVREKFINKQIPYKFRKNGMASPVVYSDQQ
ncbi:MAG TPA: hypothetical protein DDW54_00915 [Clostridiales bacterium]|nr:hypothetical protein [Clostridiales bacterium]